MKIYICNDVWWNILPFFGRFELGLKLALLSPRFDALVDAHFNGKSELTIWREIIIQKDRQTKEAKLIVLLEESRFAIFPLPDDPLPVKMRFKNLLQIWHIDNSVIAFLRSNKQIFDKGTDIRLSIPSEKLEIWDVMAREIWPIFAENIHRLSSLDHKRLRILRLRISPTILTDLKLLNSIDSGGLLPKLNAGDGSAQALAKWLHTPTIDGQPKRLRCRDSEDGRRGKTLIVNFKEAFPNATSAACYEIQIEFSEYGEDDDVLPIGAFELVNQLTKETLTLTKNEEYAGRMECQWLLKRCPIGKTVQQQHRGETLDNLNGIFFFFGCRRYWPSVSASNYQSSAESSPGSSDQLKK